jgi:hypothetical protein
LDARRGVRTRRRSQCYVDEYARLRNKVDKVNYSRPRNSFFIEVR